MSQTMKEANSQDGKWINMKHVYLYLVESIAVSWVFVIGVVHLKDSAELTTHNCCLYYELRQRIANRCHPHLGPYSNAINRKQRIFLIQWNGRLQIQSEPQPQPFAPKFNEVKWRALHLWAHSSRERRDCLRQSGRNKWRAQFGPFEMSNLQRLGNQRGWFWVLFLYVWTRLLLRC